MSESSDIEMEQCTPPELEKAAMEAVENLLPEKSKSRYEKAYKLYKDWCSAKTVQKKSESVVLAYFSDLTKTKKPTTLWATYSMLRTTLSIKENIDISKFSKLAAYLKRQNVGYRPKKSSVFSRTDIVNFLNDAPLEFLPQKVALIIGISGACRSIELFQMKLTDINFIEDKVCTTIPDTKTYRPRAFIITNKEWIVILRQYINLRVNIENDRLFMQLRYGKITKQPFGHNTIASFPKKIALYLKLKNPDTFTGHCFRRTAATLLADNGGDILQLKRLGGWKSNNVAEGYIDSSLDGQAKVANMLSNTANNIYEQSISNQELTISNEQIRHGISLNINSSGNSKVTINFNVDPNK